MVIALFGQELAEDPKFIQKFVRGGMITLEQEGDGHYSYSFETADAYLRKDNSIGFGNIPMTQQDADVFYEEFERFINER